MTSFLPRQPGLGERLAGSLQRSVPNVIQQLLQQRSGQQENEAFKQMGLNLEGIQDPKLRQLAVQGGLKQQNLSAQQMQKDIQKKEENKGFEDSLNWLDQNVDYTGPVAKFTKLAGIPGTDAYQKRQEFDAQGFWVTDKAFTHFNKGQISKEKLRVIQEDLSPRADLTRRTNRARIAAIRRLSGLPSDVPEKVFDKQLKAETKALKKIDVSTGKEQSERPPLSSFYE